MPNFCAVDWCRSSSRKKNSKQISFHRFPLKDYSLMCKWVQFVKRKHFVPSYYSKICSLHFEDSCFEYQGNTNNKKRVIKKDAIPTIVSDQRNSNEKIIKKDVIPTIVSVSSISSPKVYVLSSAKPLPSSSVMTTSLINADEFILPDQGESTSITEPDAEVEILNPLEDKPLTDNELFLTIQEIILNSSLENNTVRNVIEKVYAQFPHHDLTHRYNFIRDNVKKIIPNPYGKLRSKKER